MCLRTSSRPRPVPFGASTMSRARTTRQHVGGSSDAASRYQYCSSLSYLAPLVVLRVGRCCRRRRVADDHLRRLADTRRTLHARCDVISRCFRFRDARQRCRRHGVKGSSVVSGLNAFSCISRQSPKDSEILFSNRNVKGRSHIRCAARCCAHKNFVFYQRSNVQRMCERSLMLAQTDISVNVHCSSNYTHKLLVEYIHRVCACKTSV